MRLIVVALEIFRNYAKTQVGRFDLIFLGHVHLPLDLVESHPRLVILGGWHKASSYFVVSDGVSRHVVTPL